MKDFTLPALDELQRAVAQDIIDAFDGKREDLRGVYTRASNIAPKLYPPKSKPSGADLSRAAELYADAFLLLRSRKRPA